MLGPLLPWERSNILRDFQLIKRRHRDKHKRNIPESHVIRCCIMVAFHREITLLPGQANNRLEITITYRRVGAKWVLLAHHCSCITGRGSPRASTFTWKPLTAAPSLQALMAKGDPLQQLCTPYR